VSGRPLRHVVTVWRLCARCGPGLTGGLLLVTVLSGLLPTVAAWLTKLLVDGIAAGDALLRVAVALAGTGLVAGVLPHVGGVLQQELDRRLDRLLHDRLYTALNGFQGLSRFEDPAFLDRLRMATQASGSLGPVTGGMFDIGRNAVTVAGLVVVVAVLSPVLAGLVVAAAVPALLARLALSRRRAGMLLSVSGAARRRIFYSALATEVKAAQEIRLFGLGGFVRTRLLGEIDTAHAAERRVDRREAVVQFLLAALSAAVAGAGLVWVVWSAAHGRSTAGDVTAFAAAVTGTQAALTGLVGAVAMAHQTLLLFGHHAEVTSLPDDLAPPPSARALPALRRGIELRDVWFRYGDDLPWILRGVDLTIPHGRSTALVGLNGAGKSTLVKLLCRFYDPTRGRILWDGVDLRDVPAAELRERLAVLFQDYMEYDLTAAENIGLGEPAALEDRPRITGAARLAGADPVVAALPQGYDTMLSRIFFGGESPGVTLSGGQWQRLALAGALMREQRDLLILDEPSAGLDARAEHEIHERLRQHRAGRTSVLVSHRLGAIREADTIVVLAGGKVIERGGHEELMAGGGVYAELFEVQASGYQERTPG